MIHKKYNIWFLGMMLFSIFYLSYNYAAQVLPDNSNLCRRPLKPIEDSTLQDVRLARQVFTPIYNYPYCSNSTKTVLKRVVPEEIVSVSIGENDYPLSGMFPQGVTYRLLSPEENGGELGAMGLVIDHTVYHLPFNSTQITFKRSPDVMGGIPVPVQTVRMESIDEDKTQSVCGGKIAFNAELYFNHAVEVFNDHRTALEGNRGHLVDLTNSGFYLKGLYLNHETGLDLSSLENIDIPVDNAVIVFLDQNSGNITIDETVKTPSSQTPYQIVFVGIDTSLNGTMNVTQRINQPATRIEYDGAGAFIDCSRNSICEIFNVNLRGTDADTSNRKLVDSPNLFAFYLSSTITNSTGVETTYTYESGRFNQRDIYVHAAEDITDVEDVACRVCNHDHCRVNRFCYGGRVNCADTTVLEVAYSCIKYDLADQVTTASDITRAGTIGADLPLPPTTSTGNYSFILWTSGICSSVLLSAAALGYKAYCYHKKKYCFKERNRYNIDHINRQPVSHIEIPLSPEEAPPSYRQIQNLERPDQPFSEEEKQEALESIPPPSYEDVMRQDR